MFTITREFKFEAGHRHIGGKPKLPKGYNYHPYRAVVTIECDKLDSNGMTVDFDVIKERVGGWIKEHWDRNFLLSGADFNISRLDILTQESFGRKVHICKYGSPSAENLAHELYDVAYTNLASESIRVVSVTIWETKRCSATYSEGRK